MASETDEYESMLLDDTTTVGVQISVDGTWCMCTCVVLPHWPSVNLIVGGLLLSDFWPSVNSIVGGLLLMEAGNN